MMSTEGYRKHYLRVRLMEYSFQEQAEHARFAGAAGLEANEGSFRIVYYWHAARQIFLMLYLYSKAEQGDLTAVQRRSLGKLINENLK